MNYYLVDKIIYEQHGYTLVLITCMQYKNDLIQKVTNLISN